ncbi:hypothetical protein EV361DRAFT_952830 [Lentinula raphanica]|nr:hypothetical protein EV361DRAFT_952830 [Lentinula raphanica]
MSLTHFDSLPLIYPEESTWPHLNDDSPLRKQISDVEHELLLLERQISELSRIKEAKKAELGMLRNELAPIHRLPLEIISRIFEEACHPGVDVTQANSALTAAFIPRVCAVWMKIAYTSPRIWSKLHLNTYQHSKAIKCDPSWVKRWLDRSGTLPIDLDLDFSRRGNLALRRDLDANKLMMLILDFCERIRSLKVRAHLKTVSPLFRLPPDSFPLLEEVHIMTIPGGSTVQVSSIKSFEGATNLREVKLSGIHNTYIPLVWMILPIEQLTSLQIDALAPEEIYVDILSRCSNLTSLDMCMSFSDMPVISEDIQISLPSLQSLSLSCHATSSLLCCITAPLVTDLCVGLRGDQDIRILARDLERFQQRSSANLVSFTLTDLGYATGNNNEIMDGLTTILKTVSSISRFHLHGEHYVDINTKLVRKLTYMEGSPILLPNLTCFEMNWSLLSFQLEIRLPGLKDMILSRTSYLAVDGGNTSVVRLCRVSIRGIKIQKEDIARIREIPGLMFDCEHFG